MERRRDADGDRRREFLSDDTVDLVFNLSKGDDHRGPWNEAPKFRLEEDPKPRGGLPPAPVNPDDEKMSLAAK